MTETPDAGAPGDLPSETPDPGPSTPPPGTPPRRGIRWKRYVAVAVLSPVIALALYTVLAYHWSYSNGDRSGVLRKLSRKGWICKTWEGELAQTPIPGAVPEIWHFTIRNDSIARAVNQALGRSVVLHYAEHRGLWTSCFGDTPYFVDSLRVIP